MRLRRSGRLAERDAEQLADYARVLVRAGYLDVAAVEAELVESGAPGHDGAERWNLAHHLVGQAADELAAEQPGWPRVTDFDKVQAAFAELSTRGIAVLEHVEDHWAAAAELERRDEAGERLPGIVWFTPPDVWHAVDHGMLELNLWHGDGANVAPGDGLLADVLAVLSAHGLGAGFDEGRIEVAASWQRRR